MAPERHKSPSEEDNTNPGETNKEIRSGKEGITDGENDESREANIDPAELAIKKIEAAVTQVEELSEDGSRQMDKVEQSIGLLPEEAAAVREDTKISEQLQAIGDNAKFIAKEFAASVSDLAGAKNNIAEQNTENGNAMEMVRREKEIREPLIKEAREKYIQLLEERGVFKLSRDDYQKYLSPEIADSEDILMQQNVGNCKIVSGIGGLSKSPHFEILCRSSMERFPDGSWQVRIPLLNEYGKLVTITPEELLTQKNKRYLRRVKGTLITPDFRKYLDPVKGKEGMRVLEAAHSKAKYGTVDRSAEEMSNDKADDVLMLFGGENFIENSISASETIWLQAGGTRQIERKLTSLHPHKMDRLDNFLNNFDPEIYIAVGGTMSKPSEPMENGEFMVGRHCYIFSNVDPKKEMISLVNPWDVSETTEITFKHFKENFCKLNLIRINNAALLKNISRVANSGGSNVNINSNSN